MVKVVYGRVGIGGGEGRSSVRGGGIEVGFYMWRIILRCFCPVGE